MVINNTFNIDFERLMKLRLVVARFGEMDGARWWNTNGLLGRQGTTLMRRGFPKTHSFAQARVVFAVARARCNEVFNPPKSHTLWNLPAALEDQFEREWQHWLDDHSDWVDFFTSIQELPDTNLLACLRAFDLISDEQESSLQGTRRSSEGKAVPLPGIPEINDATMSLLAGGFFRGEPGSPAIPYARQAD